MIIINQNINKNYVNFLFDLKIFVICTIGSFVGAEITGEMVFTQNLDECHFEVFSEVKAKYSSSFQKKDQIEKQVVGGHFLL